MEKETNYNNFSARTNDAFMQTPVAYMLASLGFCGLATWWTYLVFAPATPLLSFVALDTGVYCLLLSILVAISGLLICIRKADAFFDRLQGLIIPGTLLFFLPAFIVAFLVEAQLVPVYEPLLYAVWFFFGPGELFLSLAWVVLFSLMSARWIALSIAAGGALSPPLIVLLLNAEIPFLGLAGVLSVVLMSCALAVYCLKRTGKEQLQVMRGYQREPTIKLKSAVSVAVHGFAYGFIVTMLCSLGISAVIIACAIAIAGSLISILWAYRRTKPRWNLANVQRMTIPLIVAILLFIPFLDETARTICGGLVLAAFAYTKLMWLTELVITNAEFQLYPVKRFAASQLTRWIGLIPGSLISLIVFYTMPLSFNHLVIVCCVMVVVIVAVYSWYTSEREEEPVDEISLVVPLSVSEDNEGDFERYASPFRGRCNALAGKYGLTNREAEVLVCLAKGRNTEYIQQSLFISGNTVRTHISHIYKKTGVSSQQQLIDMIDDRQISAKPKPNLVE